jgi:hypothetical protein
MQRFSIHNHFNAFRISETEAHPCHDAEPAQAQVELCREKTLLAAESLALSKQKPGLIAVAYTLRPHARSIVD